jgi:hypothetical protein
VTRFCRAQRSTHSGFTRSTGRDRGERRCRRRRRQPRGQPTGHADRSCSPVSVWPTIVTARKPTRRTPLYAAFNARVRTSEGRSRAEAGVDRAWYPARPSPAGWSAAERKQACNLFFASVRESVDSNKAAAVSGCNIFIPLGINKLAPCLCQQPEDLVIPYIGPGFIAALRNRAHFGRKKVVVGGSLVTHLSVNWGPSKRRFPPNNLRPV